MRTGTSTRLDDRVFAMCEFKTQPLQQMMRMVHPDLYRLDSISDKVRPDRSVCWCVCVSRLCVVGLQMLDCLLSVFILLTLLERQRKNQSIQPSVCHLQGALHLNDTVVPQPPLLRLSAECLSREGAFLMDCGHVSPGLHI